MARDEGPSDVAQRMNERLGGWDAGLGLRILSASREEVVACYDAGPRHHQPYGIVHGGVHASVIETVCSTGAGVDALARGLAVVGLENHTSFIRAVRSGRVTVRARPVHRGRRTQVWEATATDERGRVVSTGRVRLLCLEPGAALAGQPVEVSPSSD